jgi:hypothetical protein
MEPDGPIGEQVASVNLINQAVLGETRSFVLDDTIFPAA